MEHKSFSLGEFKALEDGENGSFEAIVAVFGNVDAGNDRVLPGAFTKSLAEWKARGRSVPVLWSHDSDTVPIGVVTDAAETKEGLRVRARLFVDDNPQSKAVHAAMKGGALQEFSFGYGARDYTHTTEGGKRIRNLKELHLGEISPVFAGMNPKTRLVGVKSAQIDLGNLGIDELKTLGDRVTAEIEERQTKALEDAAAPADTPTAPVVEEHNDNPEPNPAADVAGEEAKARIRALQAEKPIHLET